MLDMKNLYPNVKRIAKEKGTGIGEVEKAAGVSIGYFSKIRDKSACLSAAKLIRAANFLDVKIEDLLEDPPVVTNAAMFEQIFELNPLYEMPKDDFWREPYKWNYDCIQEVEA